jgi:hypothetical protein
MTSAAKRHLYLIFGILISFTKRHLYLIFGILISLVLLWLLFRDINFDSLIGTLKDANYWWLIPNVALIVLTMYQRAWRWHFMVAPIKKVPFSKLLAATCIGFMANNVLPLRLGEFVRAYSLASQDRGITKSASLATIFVERMVFDLVALLLIFGVIFWFSPNLRGHVDDNIIVGVYTAILIALIGIILVLVLALKPDRVGETFTKYLFFLPERAKEPIKNIIIKFSRGLEFVTGGGFRRVGHRLDIHPHPFVARICGGLSLRRGSVAGCLRRQQGRRPVVRFGASRYPVYSGYGDGLLFPEERTPVPQKAPAGSLRRRVAAISRYLPAIIAFSEPISPPREVQT